jgi:hypothetical protein
MVGVHCVFWVNGKLIWIRYDLIEAIGFRYVRWIHKLIWVRNDLVG